MNKEDLPEDLPEEQDKPLEEDTRYAYRLKQGVPIKEIKREDELLEMGLSPLEARIQLDKEKEGQPKMVARGRYEGDIIIKPEEVPQIPKKEQVIEKGKKGIYKKIFGEKSKKEDVEKETVEKKHTVKIAPTRPESVEEYTGVSLRDIGKGSMGAEKYEKPYHTPVETFVTSRDPFGTEEFFRGNITKRYHVDTKGRKQQKININRISPPDVSIGFNIGTIEPDVRLKHVNREREERYIVKPGKPKVKTSGKKLKIKVSRPKPKTQFRGRKLRLPSVAEKKPDTLFWLSESREDVPISKRKFMETLKL